MTNDAPLPVRVLVVDDDPDIREFVGGVLESVKAGDMLQKPFSAEDVLRFIPSVLT
jgi:DNA-binding response OmpR family regulator